ncbi:MAG: pirin family protein [Burkholderiaceae bacterium]
MSSIETLVRGRTLDLGDGLTVRRVLPHAARRSVGPFVFVDHFGPIVFAPGRGMDVRPHPHIGLATVTYLFDGAVVHRDSLGSVQRIEPGAVNWMVAGRGVVHSERSPDQERRRGHVLHGVQTWVALPVEHEEEAPFFAHHPAVMLPLVERPGVRIHLLVGRAFGHSSPVATRSDTLYCALELDADAQVSIPPEHAERAVYAVDGRVSIDGEPVEAGQLAVLAASGTVELAARRAARVMLLGGDPLGPRMVWWNFVSSRAERIEQAKADWAAHRLGRIEGETEFIPLPER